MKRSRAPTTRLGGKAYRGMRVSVVVAAAALLVSWYVPTSVQASAGDLDPSFGSGGKVTTKIGAGAAAAAIAIQEDARVVAAGLADGGDNGNDFGVARYKSDGTLDPDFGSGGLTALDFHGGYDIARAIAVQPDGKIVVAGFAGVPGLNFDFGLARYNTNGTMDPSFGAGGRVTTDFFGSSDRAFAMALQPDGKIVAVGHTLTSVSQLDFAVARYNRDGSLDSSFGENGRVNTDFFGDDDEAFAVAIMPDGRVLTAGYARAPSDGKTSFALTRYNSDGSLDRRFGTNGSVTTDFSGPLNEALCVVVTPDGQALVAGRTETTAPSSNSGFALARFSPDGSLDSSFGSEGKVTTGFSGGADGGSAVGIQGDGKIVMAGTSGSNSGDFALVRFNADGSLDTSFGTSGKVTTDFFGDEDSCLALALSANGRVFAAGYAITTGSNPKRVFALASYIAGEATEPDFALGFDSPTINATRGTKVRARISINRTVGFTGNVTVTPPDASAAGIIPKPPEPISTTDAVVVFKLKIKSLASPGPQQLTFSGRDDAGHVRTATVTVVIE